MNKDLVCQEKKLNVTIKLNNTKMFNFDYVTKKRFKRT